jgi:hypothetical protein
MALVPGALLFFGLGYFPIFVLRLFGSSVSTVTELEAGRPGFDSQQGQCYFFLFAAALRPAVGPTQPPIKWLPGVKRPGREADQLPPHSAEVKNTWSYSSTAPLRHDVILSKAREQF